jgi:hypothetical protein
VAQPSRSAGPEVLEEGESTAWPGQPNGGGVREQTASNIADDFFAKGADKEFQCAGYWGLTSESHASASWILGAVKRG